MAVPNIIFGNLRAPISDHLPQFFVAPNIFFSMPLTLSPIIMKETGQDLIKKILYLISWLTGIIICLHQTQTLKNPAKFSLKSLSLYLKLKHL